VIENQERETGIKINQRKDNRGCKQNRQEGGFSIE